MIQYSSINSSNISINGLRRHSGTLKSLENKPITKNATRKDTYYMTIVSLGTWLLVTNITYYSFTIWESIMHLKNTSFFKSDLTIKIQAVSSVLFNSNHYIHIIVYMLFHKTFRLSLKKMFVKLLGKLNLNSIFMSNLFYSDMDSSQNRNMNQTPKNLELSLEILTGSNLIHNKINESDLNRNNQKQLNMKFFERESIPFIDENSEEVF